MSDSTIPPLADKSWIDRVFQHSCEQMPEIPDSSVHACVTSPPYFHLREYEAEGQIGQEPTLEQYVARLVDVFREVRRVLRPDGTLWLNLGDSYAGSWGAQGRTGEMSGRSVISARQIASHPHNESRTGAIRAAGLKAKDQMLVPHTVALALRADGWWLRDTIVWHKPNPMPSSVTDRTTPAHEYVFLLTKKARYFYDQDAIREPLAESSVARLSQDVEAQEGSTRANGGAKTNGAMKAVGTRWDERKANGAPMRHGLTGVTESNVGGVSFVGANARSVWSVPTEGYAEAHFATMPRELARRCIVAGSPKDGIVVDPFMGSGTTAEVAIGCGRHFVGYELNPEYCTLIRERLGLFGEGVA